MFSMRWASGCMSRCAGIFPQEQRARSKYQWHVRARIAGSILSQGLSVRRTKSYKSIGMWALLAWSYPRSNSDFKRIRLLPLILCDSRADVRVGGRRVRSKGTAPSKRAVFGAALMLRIPFWAPPSHVMKFGPIGIAGDLDQPVPPRHDHIEALAKRRRRGLRSMR